MNWRMTSLALTAVTAATSMLSAQPPLPTNRFPKASLTLSDQVLCDRFKANDATLTTNDWQRLHAILPRVSSTPNEAGDLNSEPLMTKEQVIDLLGVPTQDRTNTLVYTLGWTNGIVHALWIGMKDGHVHRAMYLKVDP
jgi:hypothetical protein